MAANSDLITGNGPSHLRSSPEINKFSSLQGNNPAIVQPKWAIVAVLLAGIAGTILLGLGVSGTFGSAGSLAHIGLLASGAVLTVFSCSGMVWLAIRNCQKPTALQTETLDEDTSSKPLTGSQPASELPDHKIGPAQGCAIAETLNNLIPKFFELKDQARAKLYFSRTIKELLGAEVFFPKAGKIETNPVKPLDLSVFQLSVSQGVESDIPRSSQDADRVHVYQVASQYNAAEAPHRYTPAVGTAMQSSEHDHTQGPLAQRTNPAAFECVTAFLANLGFNMLHKVLPSAGKTFQEGSAIEHGYLCPTDANIEQLTLEFAQNYSEAEYVCYSSFSKDWGGTQPVYLMLQAAPAIGYASGLTKNSDVLKNYAALANYLAFFRLGIALAQAKGKPVVLHAAAVGGGVFDNEASNLEWGFLIAALTWQEEMKAAGVTVQLEAYQGEGHLRTIADHLKIPQKGRIGD